MGQYADDQDNECHHENPTAQHEGCMQHHEMRCMDQDEVAETRQMGKTQGCMGHDEMGCMEQDEVGQPGPSMEQWSVALNEVHAIRSCH